MWKQDVESTENIGIRKATHRLRRLEEENERLKYRLARLESTQFSRKANSSGQPRPHSGQNGALLQATIDSLPLAISVKNLKGHEVMANRYWIGLMPSTRSKPRLRRNADPFDTIQPESAAAAEELVRRTKIPAPSFEAKITRKGDIRTFQVFKQPLLGIDGELSHIVTIGADITRQKKTEEQLRHAQKMEAVGQLTGGIAHDFNNLLAIIIGNLELLTQDLPKGSSLTSSLEQAIGAAERGAKLTQQLLSFSRRQALTPKPVDLRLLVSDMTQLFKRTLGEDVEIKVRHGESLWPCRADKTQLQNALLNLVINARDAMPDGGKLLIETGNAYLEETLDTGDPDFRPGEYVMLSVSDSGDGMDAKTKNRIFEPFFTTKGLGRGTGLGLSMVYGLVKQLGGQVIVSSKIGQGTTLRIYLPRADEMTSVAMQDENSKGVASTAKIVRTARRVLIVEDNAEVADLARVILERHGHVVRQASDGSEALSFLSEADEPIDILLTDIVLPGRLNGWRTAKQAKKMIPQLRVVFMSGHKEKLEFGAQELMPEDVLLFKPFRTQSLTQAIERASCDPEAAAAPSRGVA